MTADQLDVRQEVYPLDVALCGGCGHVQLLQVVDPRILFENYVYVSGTSQVFVDHFRRYAHDVVEKLAVAPGSLVVDIGSNDGTLLRCFKEEGCAVLGIDPALSIAAAATASGIETLPRFFTAELAREVRDSHGPAAVVTANNVFAHIDDLRGVLEGVRTLLAPDGVFVFEVSYLVDVYEKTLFDTIYHEHLSYHSVKPLIAFFESNGMSLIDAERVPSHGGSLRGFAMLAGGPRPVSPGVAGLVGLEGRLGLDRAPTFASFAARIDGLRDQLTTLLAELKRKGDRIAGFGAPAKATTLLHHFRLGSGVLDYIVDESPLKQGLYTPGQHIPVVAARAMAESPPDHLLILAWNFAEPIMAKNAGFGGDFIVPLPELLVRRAAG